MFYGPAGAGKTNVLLTLTSLLCGPSKRCLYISTEGTLHYEKIARAPERYEGVEFSEALDLDELLRLLTVVAVGNRRYDAVVVDSVNGPYRPVSGRPESLTKFVYILGRLYDMALGGAKVMASAQVRASDEEEVEASGYSLLDFYFETVFFVGVEEGTRFLRLVKPRTEAMRVRFEVGDEGARFVGWE